MRSVVIVVSCVFSSWVMAGETSLDTVQLLIKKLASKDFETRESASESLKRLPEASKSLREAFQSADPETKGRIEEILEYHERRPLRELNQLAKEGRVSEFINLVATLPASKLDPEICEAVRNLGRTIRDLHEKEGKGITKLKNSVLNTPGEWLPAVLSEKRVTEATKVRSIAKGSYFIRAQEVDLDQERVKDRQFVNELGANTSAIVASGNVRLNGETGLIFAGGSIRLIGGRIGAALFISGGDIELSNCRLEDYCSCLP